ncbi:MAG: hypothetical protein F4Z00_10285 [Acidimicrobiaceae bacterium]|nr:hypothetical protein [Acidimicrobiaceae bacterium]MCY3642543.1 hypothetical protein [Acidimicrobiaceae bacterium]MDE0494553.1 hypothetical protein [Acidimicrobiaceae bacterium]MDE0667241.1 hypothetical protein [Acidimicrobiaceae bacterium]MXZ65925.1 hypothetical protein [Acidimicrobiaceae bacterium]
MRIPHKRIAQACGVVAALVTFLPWQTTAGENGAESVLGTSTSAGQLVLVVCLITVGLVQVGWRPAWIGVGFSAAIAIRELFDSEADPAWGLAIAVVACLVASVLLVWDMFVNVGKAGDEPGGRGLSGPLGRRRR